MTDTIIKEVAWHTNMRVDTIPNINYGGCGIVAAKLYTVFDKLGIPCEIIALGRESNVEGFNLFIKWAMQHKSGKVTRENMPQFGHIVLKVSGKYMDSTGIYSSISEIPCYSDRIAMNGLTIDILRRMNKNPYLWNNTFRRDKYYSQIKSSFKLIYHKTKKLC